AVEGSLQRSGAVEQPEARAERWRMRGARRRWPTDVRAPSWGGFSVLRRHLGCRLRGCDRAVIAFYLWGSDDALVAFLFPCRLATGQWPCLGSGLLTLNATGRYVAFRSEGGPLVIVTWWRQAGCRLPVLKATHLWSRSGCSSFCSSSWCSNFSCRAVWAGVGRRPFRGFRKGCRVCPCLLGLSWLQASCVVSVSSLVWVWDAEGFGVLSWRRPDSPLSHCLSLRWFRSHVVVPGVRPQLAQAAVLRELVCFCGGSISPFAGVEVRARLESRARGLRVPLLTASGSGLVAVVVTMFPRDVLSVPRCPSCTAVTTWLCLVSMGIVGLALGRPVFLVVPARCSLGSVVPFVGASPWWHRRVWLLYLAVYPGSGVVLLVGPRLFGGLRWPCLRVPAALAGEGLVIPTGPCSRGSSPLLSSARGSSLRELGVGRVAEAVVAPCVVSSSESECCELLYQSELRVVFCKSSGLL
ncbi:hypothetical protein Taro_051129, partial [Colocasia esculenta]|nr:hypothetical protein [Colocasia esculenta]